MDKLNEIDNGENARLLLEEYACFYCYCEKLHLGICAHRVDFDEVGANRRVAWR